MRQRAMQKKGEERKGKVYWKFWEMYIYLQIDRAIYQPSV